MALTGFKLAADNDIAIEGNDFVLITDDEYLSQKIQAVLQTYYGEWWLDVEIGIPYFTDIFVKSPNLAVIRNIFTKAILGVQGVLSIVTLDLEVQSDRTLNVRFQARSANGIASGEITL